MHFYVLITGAVLLFLALGIIPRFGSLEPCIKRLFEFCIELQLICSVYIINAL